MERSIEPEQDARLRQRRGKVAPDPREAFAGGLGFTRAGRKDADAVEGLSLESRWRRCLEESLIASD